MVSISPCTGSSWTLTPACCSRSRVAASTRSVLQAMSLKKLGEKACPYNALYWDFFARHQATLGSNFRLGMTYRQLQKMEGPQLDALREHASQLRMRLDTL